MYFLLTYFFWLLCLSEEDRSGCQFGQIFFHHLHPDVDSGKCYFHSCDHERENIPQTNKSILLFLNKLLKLAYLALSAQNKEKKKQQKCVDKFDLFVKVFMSNQLLEIRQGLSFEEFFPSTMFGKTSKMSHLNFCAKKGWLQCEFAQSQRTAPFSDFRGGRPCFNFKLRCEKITEKISFNIASEASYVYILSGQKLIKHAKNVAFWRVFENLKLAVKQCYQTSQF